MTSTFLKQVSAGALGLALVAAPTFAFAHDDSYRPDRVGSPIEVMISGNGKTTVRGARVTDVSGSVIAAQTMWNDTTINWTVRTDSDTDFLRKTGSNAGIADINDGDYVSFSGMLATNGSFTVDADVVKNWSLASDARTVVTGTVTDVDDNDFTIETPGRGAVVVETTSSTDYSGSIDSFSDIEVGTKVVAYGSFDADSKTLTATQVAVNAKAVVKGEVKRDNGNHLGQWLKNLMPKWFNR